MRLPKSPKPTRPLDPIRRWQSSRPRPLTPGLFLLGSALASAGCLNRPVVEATPTTTNLFVDTIRNAAVTKIDLLFMIDTSQSMIDKQKILEKAVPVLLNRLVAPNCLGEGDAVVGTADAFGHCTRGKPEFRSISDIHVGIITSSLGNHGGTTCTPDSKDVAEQNTPDDRAELLPLANPAVRGALPSWNGSGFLAWDPGQDKNAPPGESNLGALLGDFSTQVSKAGENGCGLESSLEAWYRFLVDPEPPVSVSVNAGFVQKGPVNQVLLAQRSAFLRPDSLLAIVMLSDENDCSINDDDGSQGFFASKTDSRMPRASAACATSSNDRCCHSCGAPAPEGCPSNAEDTECSKKTANDYARMTLQEDQNNLRCFDQKRRFGMDFLYPVQRYIDGLTKATVRNRAGVEVTNPIFAPGADGEVRPSDLVLLAGIVGVPWQDLSTEGSWTGNGLTYLNGEQLEKAGRWPLILGTDTAPASDPLMHETVEPRDGSHPLLNFSLVPPDSALPDNPVNGHEQKVPARDDLQFACTFTLPTPRVCSDSSCDCNADERDKDSPLCTYPADPMAEGTQIAAKAYPGRRQLEVLRGLRENAITASICPKNTAPAAGLTEAADPAYGYNPAIAALLELMKARFPSQCLPRALDVESNPASPDFGRVPCAVVEAVPKRGGACSCDENRGRKALDQSERGVPGAVEERMRAEKVCGGDTGVACSDFCQCKIEPLAGEELAACQDGSEDQTLYGYCYVDPAKGIGNSELVKECPQTQQRILRFVGNGLPASGSVTFMACFGTQFDEDAENAPSEP